MGRGSYNGTHIRVHVTGDLLLFWLPPRTPNRVHTRFRQWLYGREVETGDGKYRYRRWGALERERHVLLYTGAVILPKGAGKRIAAMLRQKGAVVLEREVVLTKDDRRRLRLHPRSPS